MDSPIGKKLPAFADVQQVMDLAAERPRGLRYRLPTFGAAVNFRQRCYTFRVKQQELAKEQYGMVPGYAPSTPYDDLELKIVDATGRVLRKKPAIAPAFVDILFLHREPSGQLLDVETAEALSETISLDEEGSLDLE